LDIMLLCVRWYVAYALSLRSTRARTRVSPGSVVGRAAVDADAFTDRKLERAADLKAANESLRYRTLYEIAAMMRAHIPSAAYEHPTCAH
jgi:hypothetical protein